MTKTDKLIFSAVLLLALLFLFCFDVLLTPRGAKTIVIEQNGTTYARYRMAELKAPSYLEIETKQGKNVVKISKDGASMEQTDCRDQACLGEISSPGQSLICLPHRLIVRIYGEKGVDAVAY